MSQPKTYTDVVRAARIAFTELRGPTSAKEAELSAHLDQLTDNMLIAAKNLDKEIAKR